MRKHHAGSFGMSVLEQRASIEASSASVFPAALGKILIHGIFWIIAACYAYSLGYNNVSHSGQFTPDSVVYVNAGENIATGNGISVSFAHFDHAVRHDIDLPAALTEYGPGYPIVLSVAPIFGIDARNFGLIITPVFMFLFFVSTYFAVRAVSSSEAGFFAVALLTSFEALENASRHIWTETMGLTFLTLAFGLMICALKETRKMKAGYLLFFLVGVSAGLALATRYALAPLLLVVLLCLIERNWRRLTVRALCFLGGYSLVGVPLVARKFYHSIPHPGDVLIRDVSIVQALEDLMRVLRYLATPSLSLVSLACLVLTIATLVYILTPNGKSDARVYFKQLHSGGGSFLILWPAVYLCFLLWSQTQLHIDPIDARLVLPASVFVPIVSCVVVCRITLIPRNLFLALALILLSLEAYPETSTASTVRKVFASRPGSVWQHSPLRSELEYVKSRQGPSTLIIAEDGLMVPFFLGPIRTLYFSGSPQASPEELKNYIAVRAGQTTPILVLLKFIAPDATSDEREKFNLKHDYFATALGELEPQFEGGEFLVLEAVSPGQKSSSPVSTN